MISTVVAYRCYLGLGQLTHPSERKSLILQIISLVFRHNGEMWVISVYEGPSLSLGLAAIRKICDMQ